MSPRDPGEDARLRRPQVNGPPESVAALLQQSLRAIEAESPDAFRALCGALRGLEIACRVGEETFTLRGGDWCVRVESVSHSVDAHIRVAPRGLFDVLDGRRTLLEALLDDTIALMAPVGVIVSLHDGLAAMVHGAATAPSCGPLGARLAAVAGAASLERSIVRH